MDPPYLRHIFVCTHGKTCPTQGSEGVHRRLKDLVFEAGLGDEIRVNRSGCFAQCGHGPMVVVYPGAHWYAAVTEEDAEAILASVRGGGRPPEHLLYRPAGPGKNVCVPGEAPGTIAPTPPAAPPGPA